MALDDPRVLGKVLHDLLLDKPLQYTMLDWFAYQAMHSMVHTMSLFASEEDAVIQMTRIAKRAYKMAQLMLEERSDLLEQKE